mmetsp:Transcript_6837/g.10008  ORF Transcript_6837/g.10008 Transcript_6837/m.10008 type:complete len:239 (+) Transcript_6837:904-1620(+)
MYSMACKVAHRATAAPLCEMIALNAGSASMRCVRARAASSLTSGEFSGPKCRTSTGTIASTDNDDILSSVPTEISSQSSVSAWIFRVSPEGVFRIDRILLTIENPGSPPGSRSSKPELSLCRRPLRAFAPRSLSSELGPSSSGFMGISFALLPALGSISDLSGRGRLFSRFLSSRVNPPDLLRLPLRTGVCFRVGFSPLTTDSPLPRVFLSGETDPLSSAWFSPLETFSAPVGTQRGS